MRLALLFNLVQLTAYFIVCHESGVIHNIQDFQLSASSYIEGYPPSKGRLIVGETGWCAEQLDPTPYFQIDLLVPIAVEGLVVKGWIEVFYSNLSDKVVARGMDSFTVLYGNTTDSLMVMTKDAHKRVFEIHISSNLTQTNQFFFLPAIKTRYLRIQPTVPALHGACMQLDFIGTEEAALVYFDECNNETLEAGVYPVDKIAISPSQKAILRLNQTPSTSYECQMLCSQTTECKVAMFDTLQLTCDVFGDVTYHRPMILKSRFDVDLYWKVCVEANDTADAIDSSTFVSEDMVMHGQYFVETPMYPFESSSIITFHHTWYIELRTGYPLIAFEDIDFKGQCSVKVRDDAKTALVEINIDRQFNGRQPGVVAGKLSVHLTLQRCDPAMGSRFRSVIGLSDLPTPGTALPHTITGDARILSDTFIDTALYNSHHTSITTVAFSFGFSDFIVVKFPRFQVLCDGVSSFKFYKRSSKNVEFEDFCNLRRPPLFLNLRADGGRLYRFSLSTQYDQHLPLQGFVMSVSKFWYTSKHDEVQHFKKTGIIAHYGGGFGAASPPSYLPKLCSSTMCFYLRGRFPSDPGLATFAITRMKNIDGFKFLLQVRFKLTTEYHDHTFLNGVTLVANSKGWCILGGAVALPMIHAILIYISVIMEVFEQPPTRLAARKLIPPAPGKAKKLYHWRDGTPLIFSAWSENKITKLPTQDVYVVVRDNDEDFHQGLHVWDVDYTARFRYIYTSVPDNYKAPVKLVESLRNQLPKSESTAGKGQLFRCGSSEFVSVLTLCDKIFDCFDKTDEENCTTDSCKGKFLCQPDECVPYSLVCDFLQDCSNGRDEIDCDFKSCESHQFQCNNKQCLDNNTLCNGTEECEDGSDEIDCEVCLGWSLNCGNGKCLENFRVCDGFVDCLETVENDEQNGCNNEQPMKFPGELVDCVAIWNRGKRESGTYRLITNSAIATEFEVECNFEKVNSHKTIRSIFHNIDLVFESEYVIMLGIHDQQPVFLFSENIDCFQSFRQTCPPYRMMLANQFDLLYHHEYWDCLCIDAMYWRNASVTMTACTNATQTLMESLNIRLEDRWLVTFIDNEIPIEGRWEWNQTRIDELGLTERVMNLQLFAGAFECSHVLSDAEVNATISCVRGKPVPASTRCLNDYREDGNVNGCRDLTHIQGCETFVCPYGYVKCPESFCIPIRLLCDGEKDCLEGEDEVDCNMTDTNQPKCDGLYRCRNSQVCIPPSQVCDRIKHCPQGDDERLCDLDCPSFCTCIEYEISCHNMKETDKLLNLPKIIRKLDVSGNEITEVLNMDFPFLVILNMSACSLKSITSDTFALVMNLQILDLSHNALTTLVNGTFKGLVNLVQLFLHGNTELARLQPGSFLDLEKLSHLEIKGTKISYLQEGTFHGLDNLQSLDISQNHIRTIDDGAFKDLGNLLLLNMVGNVIEMFKNNIFLGLNNLLDLETDEYQFCCLKPDTVAKDRCLPAEDEFSSCSDLMRYEGPRFLLWIIGSLALVGNILSMLYRVTFDKKRLKIGYGIFVTNLCIADFFMGIYLLIIAGADIFYRGRYIWVSNTWRHSALCTFAGVMSSMSSEGSVIFICLITLDRILVIKYPFGGKKFTTKFALTASACSWMVIAFFALLPVLDKKSFWGEFYATNGVCLALPLTRLRPRGWEFAFAVFVVFNFLAFLLIAVGQGFIYQEINSVMGKARTGKRKQDLVIARNLLLVVATDFLCWCPIGVIGIMALSGYVISSDVYLWTCVLVLPINSALNPFLYTFSAIIKKKDFSPSLNEQTADATIGSDAFTKVFKSGLFVGHMIPGYKTLDEYANLRPMTRSDVVSIVVMIARRIMFLHDLGMCLGSLTASSVTFRDVDQTLTGMVLVIVPKVVRGDEDQSLDLYLLGDMTRRLLNACKDKRRLQSASSCDEEPSPGTSANQVKNAHSNGKMAPDIEISESVENEGIDVE